MGGNQMPDIRLRDYTAKIKDLIRNDLQDEAIAHCQHILRHYPKHIETYCLLGEACLEKGMYREAIEFFHRTLSGDPENFIARVGMGIIYSEQGALAEAIWQMELAFELAPGNAEVRRELQRLYAQRDGVEKTRLKLTRGALGRLYIRNGLYERALAEFRAVLRQDPDLPSIRVALIEALWREGRRLEAVETCLDLLEALPNCLKANLILGEIWMRGGHEDAGGEKLAIARALDPENRVAQEIMGKDSPLPLEDVLLPELEITGGLPALFASAKEEEVMPSGWGVDVEEMAFGVEDAFPPGLEETWAGGEQVPDWLQAMDLAGEEMEAAAPGIEEPAEEVAPSDAVPDWLRDLTDEETFLASAEPSLPQDSAPAAEMPDWLKEMGLAAAAESQRAEDVQPASDKLAGADMPDWLRELAMSDDEMPAPPAEKVRSGEEAPREQGPAEEIPDWLLELKTPTAEEEVLPPVAEALPEEEPAAGEVPDWLLELRTPGVQAEAAEKEAPGEEIPDWLLELKTPEAEEVEVPVEEAPGEEIPDWLLELKTPEAEEVVSPAAEVAEEAAPVEEAPLPLAEVPPSEVPESLRALVEAGILDEADLEAAIAEMSAEDLASQQAEAVPDWLQDLMVEGAPTAEEVLPPPVAEALPEAGPAPQAAVPDEEVPAWLREFQEPEVEAASREQKSADEEIPEWLREFQEPEAEAISREQEAPAVEIPEWLREFHEPEEQALAEEEQEISGEVPEWLRELEISEAEELTPLIPTAPEVEAVSPVTEGASVEEPAPQIEELVAQQDESMPEWLQDLMVEKAPEEKVAEAEEAILPTGEELEAPAVIEPAEIEVLGPPAGVEMVTTFDRIEMEQVAAVPEAEEKPEEIPVPSAAPPVETEMVAPFERPGVEEPAVTLPSRVDELLVHLKTKPRDYQSRLDVARLYAADKDWNSALAHYEKLISARKLLPAAIDDLQPLLQEPVDRVRLYQLLGDAYMQAEQLNKALEMYRLARQALAKG
jgi:tetratricopeptide (TPR) repeat protein